MTTNLVNQGATLTISQAAKAVAALVPMRVTPLLLGPPGVGKTQIVQQVAKRLGFGHVLMHMPSALPEHFAVVLPSKDGTRLEAIPPRRMPVRSIVDAGLLPERGILTFDEGPAADSTMQKLMATVIQERQLYGEPIADGWGFAITGNRATDRAGSGRLLSMLQDRVVHIHIDVSVDDWLRWAEARKVPHEIREFVQWRPNLLSAFDPNQDVCPSPRSWGEQVARIMRMNLSDEIRWSLVAGSIGNGAAAEFAAYCRMRAELPTLEQLFGDSSVSIGDKPDVHYAITQQLIEHVISAESKDARLAAFARAVKVLPRLLPDMETLFFQSVSRKAPEVRALPETVAWAKRMAM